MADEYRLNQVQVRLKLSEAEPLYSTERINTPFKAVDVMAKALATLDREYCCVVNMDSASHPINFNVVSIGDVNQAQVPIQNVFKTAILSNAASIMMFHNHPSGTLRASKDDIDVTKRIVEAGRIMNIPVIDHIIVAGGTAQHISLRVESPELFRAREAETEYSVSEPEDVREKEIEFYDGEAAYRLGDRYISIQETDEGFDYSIYDEEYHLLDGGVYDDPDANMEDVLREITDELKQPAYDEARDTYSHSPIQGNIRQGDVPIPTDYDELMENVQEAEMAGVKAARSEQDIVADFRARTENLFNTEAFDGMRPSDIEDAVNERVGRMAYEYGLDVEITDVIVSGSRCRGMENEGSDLDVVVSYTGSEREDDLFNILHDEKLYFGSVELDINPISANETGTLAQYLPTVEKYLEDKANEYKPLAKVEELLEENYNQIDNVLSNIPPSKEDREKERSVPPKKPHDRVSMREKLAEKKAEIANRDNKSPKTEKSVKPPSMGVDD